MLRSLDRFGLPVKLGVAGILGGVISVLIGPFLGLDDGQEAWLTPLATGLAGYLYGLWLTRRAGDGARDEAPGPEGEDPQPQDEAGR